jgi:hypothetical protein
MKLGLCVLLVACVAAVAGEVYYKENFDDERRVGRGINPREREC